MFGACPLPKPRGRVLRLAVLSGPVAAALRGRSFVAPPRCSHPQGPFCAGCRFARSRALVAIDDTFALIHAIKQLTIAALVLSACGTNHDARPGIEINGTITQEQVDPIGGKFTFVYETPILPDSSTHALIPMNIKDEGRGSKLTLSSSYEYDGTYMPRSWNLLFLNLRDNGTHLLTEKKVRVDGIHTHKRDQGLLLSRYVLYMLIEDDLNADGKWDHSDPSHLSISHLDGSGLTAISPKDEDLIGWDVIQGRDKLIVRTRVDGNADHKYEDHEDMRVYIYDVAVEQLQPVVSSDLQSKTNTLFFEFWLKKAKWGAPAPWSSWPPYAFAGPPRVLAIRHASTKNRLLPNSISSQMWPPDPTFGWI